MNVCIWGPAKYLSLNPALPLGELKRPPPKPPSLLEGAASRQGKGKGQKGRRAGMEKGEQGKGQSGGRETGVGW